MLVKNPNDFPLPPVYCKFVQPGDLKLITSGALIKLTTSSLRIFCGDDT